MGRFFGQCKLCLETKKLCDSHIIPKSFYHIPSVLITSFDAYVKRRPIGCYDQRILCEECEKYLNIQYDQYAKETLLDRKGVTQNIFHNSENKQDQITLYRLEDKNSYDRMSRFFISVLWRASISHYSDFQEIRLDHYEEKARLSILDQEYNFKDFFSVTLFICSDTNVKINSVCYRKRIQGVNFYIFYMGSIKAFIKCDKQGFPSWGLPSVLSSKNDALMIEDKLQSQPEFELIKALSRKNFKII